MSTQISRDPFGRYTTHRESILHAGNKNCMWCGSQGKQTKSGKYRLFKYGVEKNGLYTRINWLAEAFCSYACCKAFHEMD